MQSKATRSIKMEVQLKLLFLNLTKIANKALFLKLEKQLQWYTQEVLGFH